MILDVIQKIRVIVLSVVLFFLSVNLRVHSCQFVVKRGQRYTAGLDEGSFLADEKTIAELK
jgi:hypothetical protein